MRNLPAKQLYENAGIDSFDDAMKLVVEMRGIEIADLSKHEYGIESKEGVIRSLYLYRGTAKLALAIWHEEIAGAWDDPNDLAEHILSRLSTELPEPTRDTFISTYESQDYQELSI